ncbi:hypothetical protein V6N12_055129 [Hibiscus sabdariffa]
MVLQDQLQGVSTSTSLKFLQFPVTWMQLKSPCFWEEVSIILQLGFGGIILLHFVHKIVSKTSWNIADQATKIVPKLSLSYRASTVCSVLMLGIHVLKLLMLLNSMDDIRCNSKLKSYSSEIVPVIPWAVTIIVVCNVPKKGHMRFPWILRAWWTFSFFLSIISTVVDIYLKPGKHGHLKMLDYANFISLLASFVLQIISIRGKTGLVFIDSDNIAEPLVSGKTDKDSNQDRGSPYGRATLVELITFSWLNPLFSVGIKKPLEEDDIPDVDVKDSAEFASLAFDQNLKQVREKDGWTNPSIYKAIFLFIRQKAAINAMFAVTSAGASYIADIILVMQNGRIAQAGTFEELLKQNIGFEVLVGAHKRALQSILTVENSNKTLVDPESDGESHADSTSNAQVLQQKPGSAPPEITENGGKLVQDEEREKGSIGKEV